MLNNLLQDKKILILLSSSLLLVIILIIFIIRITVNPSTPSGNIPTPTPIIVSTKNSQEQRLSTIQKTLINIEVPQNIESTPGFEAKITLPNGNVKYSFKSPYLSRKNEVLSKDNVVIFERTLTPVKSTSPGYTKITNYTKIFGEPEELIKGSVFYGEFISTLIYPDKGFALIGNTRTDEVFEIQTFNPMDLTSYKSLYGEDMNSNPNNPL